MHLKLRASTTLIAMLAAVTLLDARWIARAPNPPKPQATTNPAAGAPPGFRVLHQIPVGPAPHGIRFSADERWAWVVLSSDDGAIAVLDLETMEVTERIPAGEQPLDLILLQDDLAVVTQFLGEELIEVALGAGGGSGPGTRRWRVGRRPSLFALRLAPDPQRPGRGPSRALLVSEFADTLSVFDTLTGEIVAEYPTGDRPYAADVTADGVRAFVPNRDAGTVSIIDLVEGEPVAEPAVCTNPEGGALTTDDAFYIVACGGDNALAWLETGSFEIVDRTEAVGPRPFSVATTDDGRWGLVNNAGGNTIAVLDVPGRRIVGEIEVGEQPIVVRLHPDGRRAFVSNEVSGDVTVVELPEAVPTARRR